MKGTYKYDNIKVVFIILLIIVIVLIYLNANKMKKSERFNTVEAPCESHEIIIHPSKLEKTGQTGQTKLKYCNLETNFDDNDGIDYRGYTNKANGKDCLDWKDMIDQLEDIVPDIGQDGLDERNLKENYCRNFEGSSQEKPWCYTGSKTDPQATLCSKDCNEMNLYGETEKYIGCLDSNILKGDTTTTQDCREWTPEEVSRGLSEGRHNYCRNMLGQDKDGNDRTNLWCMNNDGNEMDCTDRDSSIPEVEIGIGQNKGLDKYGVIQRGNQETELGQNNAISGLKEASNDKSCNYHSKIFRGTTNPIRANYLIKNPLILDFNGFKYKDYYRISEIKIYNRRTEDDHTKDGDNTKKNRQRKIKNFEMIINDIIKINIEDFVNDNDLDVISITMPEIVRELKNLKIKFRKDRKTIEKSYGNHTLNFNTISVKIMEKGTPTIKDLELGSEGKGLGLEIYGVKQRGYPALPGYENAISGDVESPRQNLYHTNWRSYHNNDHRRLNLQMAETPFQLDFSNFIFKDLYKIKKIKIYNTGNANAEAKERIRYFNLVFDGITTENISKTFTVSLDHYYKDDQKDDNILEVDVPPDLKKINNIYIALPIYGSHMNDVPQVKKPHINIKNISVMIDKEDATIGEEQYYDKFDEYIFFTFNSNNHKIINEDDNIGDLIKKIEGTVLYNNYDYTTNDLGQDGTGPYLDAFDRNKKGGIYNYNDDRKEGNITINFANQKGIEIVALVIQPLAPQSNSLPKSKFRYIKKLEYQVNDSGVASTINVYENSIYTDDFIKIASGDQDHAYSAENLINKYDIFVFKTPIPREPNFKIILNQNDKFTHDSDFSGLRLGFLIKPQKLHERINDEDPNRDKYGQSHLLGGEKYSGIKRTTAKGKLCMNWNKASNNTNLADTNNWVFPDENSNHNYCRRPNNNKDGQTDVDGVNSNFDGRTWCYISKDQDWRFC